MEDHAEPTPEQVAGGDGEGGEDELLGEGELLWFSKDGKGKEHGGREHRDSPTIQDGAQGCRGRPRVARLEPDFYHKPDPGNGPNSKMEAADHKADKAIENIINL